MANPQKENGFTGIANELLESIQMYKFTLNELKIIMSVWRFTYGFNRKSHKMSLSFIMNHTGLTRMRVNESLKALIKKNVLIKIDQGNATKSSTIAFNKNYEQWKLDKYAAFASDQFDTSVRNDTSLQDDTTSSVQDDTTPSVRDDTRGSVRNDTKERKVLNKNINKDIKENSRKSKIYDEDSIPYQLSMKLFKRILDNNPDHKKPNLQRWANDVRLMIERDKRTPEQIEYMIDWVQDDPFWKGNVLSMDKLRKQFDRLAIKIKEEIKQQSKPRREPKFVNSLREWMDQSP